MGCGVTGAINESMIEGKPLVGLPEDKARQYWLLPG